MNIFNPLVSIVIPVHNGSNYLKEAINSALDQTYKNIEVILVNYGSTDNTEEIAFSYSNKIRYFAQEDNGISAALNMAIQNAKGEYISFLSQDSLYLPHKIERQIEELNKLEDKNTILFSNWISISLNGTFINYEDLSGKYDIQLLNQPLFSLMQGVFNEGTLLVKKRLLEEFQCFNFNLLKAPDYYLWFEILRKYSIHYMPEAFLKSRKQLNSENLDFIHLKEENDLWCSIINRLTNIEIENLASSRFIFFKNLSTRMKTLGLDLAYKAALLKAFFFNNGKKNILITTAMKEGGLGRFIYDLSDNLNKYFNVFIIYVNSEKIEISFDKDIIFNFPLNLPILFPEMFIENEVSKIMKEILPLLNIDLVHINGFLLLGFNFVEVIQSYNIPMIYTVHDFQTLCLSQHFLNTKSEFCNLNKELKTCHKCLEKNIYVEWLNFKNPTEIKNYRNYINKFVLPEMSKIIFPTNFAKEVFEFYLQSQFKSINWEIIEHGIVQDSKDNLIKKESNKLRIGIIGSIQPHKGLYALKQITNKLDTNKFEFILFGNSQEELKNTRVLGKYSYKDTISLLKSYNIEVALILSEAPETYCYVLSECWAAQIPVIVTNLGAQAERVKLIQAGWIVDNNKVVEETLKVLVNLLENPQELQKKKDILNNLKLKTSIQMAENYQEIYLSLINNNKQSLTEDLLKSICLSTLLYKQNINHLIITLNQTITSAETVKSLFENLLQKAFKKFRSILHV